MTLVKLQLSVPSCARGGEVASGWGFLDGLLCVSLEPELTNEKNEAVIIGNQGIELAVIGGDNRTIEATASI